MKTLKKLVEVLGHRITVQADYNYPRMKWDILLSGTVDGRAVCMSSQITELGELSGMSVAGEMSRLISNLEKYLLAPENAQMQLI